MHITISTAAPGSERDIDVDVERGHGGVDLGALAAAAGLAVEPGAADAVVDGQRVSLSTSVDGVRWHRGARVELAGAGTNSDPPAPNADVELAVLSGTSAGRRLPLAAGVHVLGRSARADVVLDDDTVSGLHARLRVGSDGAWSIA